MVALHGRRVLIKPDEVKDVVTNAGIIIAAEQQKRPQTGTVLEVGPGLTLQDGTSIPVAVPIGARVIFNVPNAKAIRLDGVLHVVIEEQYILAEVDVDDDVKYRIKGR